MGLGDKIKQAADDAVDKAKEAVGKLNDDDGLDLDGKLERAADKAKQAGARIKDEAGEIVDDVKESAGEAAASLKATFTNDKDA